MVISGREDGIHLPLPLVPEQDPSLVVSLAGWAVEFAQIRAGRRRRAGIVCVPIQLIVTVGAFPVRVVVGRLANKWSRWARVRIGIHGLYLDWSDC